MKKGIGRLGMAAVVGMGLWMASGVEAAGTTTQTVERFNQDRFAVSFWVDPPADEQLEQRYQEIADANFNVALSGSCDSTTQTRQLLQTCQKLGLKVLVGVPKHNLDRLAEDHPALWGYMWKDEPAAPEFAGLAADVKTAHEARPGKLLFINLLPNYASAGSQGATSYEEYVRRFVDEVKPEVLCMDYYPAFRPGEADGRDGYCSNLAVMRSESLRAGIPFWNFFNTMPYGPHTDPTEAQLRWQIYASIAYGAKGVLYFCYYTPLSAEFPKGGAIIARDGRRTRHYDQARRLNAELLKLGPALMQLTSTRVVRVAPDSVTTSVLEGGPIKNLSGAPGDPKPNYLVGEFRHADGRRAVLLQNYEFAYTAWPTVKFDAKRKDVVEVDKATGREHPVVDDSPDMPGLQLSLDAGEGRLFLLPGK